jgi:hypothetical protein
MANLIKNPDVDVNIGYDQSLEILDEVFHDLDRNLYLDYKNKLNVIIDIYNNELFLKKSNSRIRDVVENLQRLPEIFNDLKNEKMRDLEVSVFQGICTSVGQNSKGIRIGRCSFEY